VITARGIKRAVENVVYLVVTVLFEARYISRAIARFLVIAVRTLEAALMRAERFWRIVKDEYGRVKMAVYIVWKHHVKGKSLHAILDETDVQMKLDRTRQLEAKKAGILTRARHELDHPYLQCCYILLVLFWAMSIWIMLTFTVEIRNTQGNKAENQVLVGWVIAMLVDNLGLQVIKSVTIKIWIHLLFVWLKENRGGHESAMIAWYEKYIAIHLNMKYMDNSFDDDAMGEYDTLGMDF
ncbi:hypothetical protein CYMTET_20590, partial [Cymbomonas tetramitiformis]